MLPMSTFAKLDSSCHDAGCDQHFVCELLAGATCFYAAGVQLCLVNFTRAIHLVIEVSMTSRGTPKDVKERCPLFVTRSARDPL